MKTIFHFHATLDASVAAPEYSYPRQAEVAQPTGVKPEPGETVVFAWIVCQSREHRDRVNEAVMKDPRIAGMTPKSMPFDGKRMFWGGCESVVELGGVEREWPVAAVARL